MLLDFGITYLLKERLHWHKYLANALGFTVAATNNFYWNKIWTFTNTDPTIGLQYSKFIAIALVGLAINTGVLMLAERRLHLHFYLAKVVLRNLSSLTYRFFYPAFVECLIIHQVFLQ